MATPYDQAVKLLSEEDPRGFLAYFAGIPSEADVEVVQLPRELVQNPIEADQIYLVHCRRQGRFLVHAEAWSRYRPEWKDKQVWYGVEAVRKFRLPLRSYVMFLERRGVPKRLPAMLKIVEGDVEVRVKVRPVRLWTVDAGAVLATNRRPLYHWVPLMKSTLAQQKEAARRIYEQRDSRAAVLMAVLARLRYDDTEAYLESIDMVLTPEILLESPFAQELMERGRREGLQKGIEKGIKKGLEKGIETGHQVGERDLLRTILQARFGSLPAWAEVRIQDASNQLLQRWAVKTLSAESLEAVLSTAE